nr:uncharacterized protein LOC105846101 [Hydra vulgaris]
MGNSCFKNEPTYARYHSNTKNNEPNLDNVVGSLLEMDPSLQDRDEGVTKINSWIEEIGPEMCMSPEHLEISRWKCIKYWEAQHTCDIYGNEYSSGLKLTGSCVRFYFEKRLDGSPPRLVIEHYGRSVNMPNNESKLLSTWAHNLRNSFRRKNKTLKIFSNDSAGDKSL